MKKKKEETFTGLSIKMILKLVILMLVINVLAGLILGPIIASKYGEFIIIEGLFALFIFLLLIKNKHQNIFLESHEKLWKSLLLGLPLIIVSIYSLIKNIIELDGIISPVALAGLIIYTILIGLFEEFLFRGWFQKSLIKKFGKDRKHIILSIVITSVVFGLIHMTNIFSGQPLATTILQTISAIAIGITLGAIYFRSNNIFSVAMIHSFWDFSILIKEVNLFRDCTPPSSMSLNDIVILVFEIVGFLAMAGILLRKEKLNEMLEVKNTSKETKEHDKKLKLALFIVIILSLGIEFIPTLNVTEGTCYEYGKIKIDNYKVTYSNFDKYMLSFNDNVYKYEIYINKDNKIEIKNILSNKIEKLDIDNVSQLIVYENKESYSIIIKYGLDQYGSEIKYTEIPKIDFSYKDDLLSNSKFTNYSLPVVSEIGYLEKDKSTYKYPYFKCKKAPSYIIENGEVLEIK